MYKLVISDDEGKTTVVPLVRDAITIGRKEGNTIRLTERNVSRRHARLTNANGSFKVEDLKSYNGVKVNGKRIADTLTLKAGDKLTIGDYALALQLDTADVATVPELQVPTSPEAPTAMLAVPPEPAPPARLVMLSPPAPGAEFALSRPLLRIGRAEDLDVWINHRSISREHAEVQRGEDGSIRIRDLASANGMRINGKDIAEAQLAPGDMLELGQVRFRFVAEGEVYTFDADRTVQMDPVAPPLRRSNASMLVGVAIIAVAVTVAALMAVMGGGPDEGIEADPTPLAPAPDPVPLPPVQPPAPQPAHTDESTVAQAVRDCGSALAEGRYLEAASFGSAALRLQPDSVSARECKQRAENMQAETEKFDEGARALERGEVDSAYIAFAMLRDGSPLRDRPEVERATRQYVELHLARAAEALTTDPSRAQREAGNVLTAFGVTASERGRAEDLQRRAAQRLRIASAKNKTKNRIRTTKTKRATVRPPPPVDPPPPVAKQRQSAMAEARACLLDNDQACVIRALKNRARSCAEVALLIETYRKVGNMGAAVRHMRSFVNRCGSHPNSPHYRQILARHAGP